MKFVVVNGLNKELNVNNLKDIDRFANQNKHHLEFVA